MSNNLNYDKLQNQINKLPLNDMLTLINGYSDANRVNMSKIKHSLILNDFQQKLIDNKVNSTCPYCGSSIIVRNGVKNDMIMFKCKDCNRNFNLFTNTILEKTRFSWDVWVSLLHMMLKHQSNKSIKYNLICDYNLYGLDLKTVLLLKHKILHGVAALPMPKLNGVIQVDETHFRESQKGSHHLKSLVKNERRLPRHGYRPSKYGCMGNEFATVVCMVDSEGYVVSKVTGLGKLTKESFTDLFESSVNSVSFLCSDGNHIYKKYCDLKKIPLYIKPSSYKNEIYANGFTSPVGYPISMYNAISEKNDKVLAELYKNKVIDYIYNFDTLTYNEFKELKNKHHLNLAKVNQFHNTLKENINMGCRNVNTKYLAEYVAFETYLRNWQVSHKLDGPPTTKADAEMILIDILKGKATYTAKDFKESKLMLPKASDKYMRLLKKHQEEIRLNNKYKYFKFSTEDGSQSFNMRKFLEDLPAYKLNKLRIKYKIPKAWAKYAVISELLKQKGIKEDIKEFIINSHDTLIDEEDEKYIDYWEYKRRNP